MKKHLLLFLMILSVGIIKAQSKMTLHEILQAIDTANPTMKMFAARISSLDEAAKGAKSAMPTDFGTGLWMTPYNPKMWQKGENGTTGMGQYMFSVQQMFPNRKKQDAEETYMEGMSSIEKENEKFN